MDVLIIILIGFVVLFGVVVLSIGVYLALPLSYPASTESDYTHHTTPWWQIYYSHKYLRPKRRAYKGSGLEERFKTLDFHFDTPELADAKTITIGAVGDLMCRKDLAGEGGSELLDDIAEPLFASDLTIGNLEFAVSTDVYFHKLLRFSVPPHYATPLIGHKSHGQFDALCLANNHINDSLHPGIVETCDMLDKAGICHTGANRTPEEQDDILYLERGGAKIAILSYTFSTNDIPLEPGKEFGTNVVRFNALSDDDYDPSLIHKHIAIAKEAGADYIISCHHWGVDLEFYPTPHMVRRAHALLDAGIDLIIGHHPHVLGPVDRYRTQDGRDGLVFYSLGNFTSKGLIFPVQRLAAMVKISLAVGRNSTGEKKVTPSGIELTPTFFSLGRSEGIKRGHVRRVKPTLEKMKSGDKSIRLTMRERLELKHVDSVFKKYFENKGNGIIYS